MGLFTRRQTDQSWLDAIRPSYEAANSVISDLNQALDDDSHAEQFEGIQRVLNQLPLVAKAVKQVPEPSSLEARQAHKALKSALKNYIDGAKQGATFFQDMHGGPGQRVLNETGFARRAATSRLVFSQTAFLELAKSGRNQFEKLSNYMLRTAD